MADISRFLNAIMAAVRGEEVRGSIHDAIDIINKVGEKQLNVGNAINPGDPAGDAYDGSLYINTTNDILLKCNGSTWVNVGTVRGNGIARIDGPVTTGLDDEYTIRYTDGAIKKFTVHNGRGIDQISGPVTNGLIDTYTVDYNDGTSYSFSLKNGNQWYHGVLVSGKNGSGASFTLPFTCKEGDSYLNISEDAIYHCTAGATMGNTSTWIYDFTITSASTGTNDYQMLINQPHINGNKLIGNKRPQELGLDDWLMDSATPPAIIEKPMAVDSKTVTFTAAEMASVYTNGWTVKPFFSVTDGQPAPSLKKMVKDDTTGDLIITHSKVKEAQAGGPSGTACKCKLRVVR